MQISIGPGLFVNEFSSLAVRYGIPVTWTALVTRADKPGAALRTVERGGALPGEVYPQIAYRPIVMQITMTDPTPLAAIDEWKEVLALPRSSRAALYAHAAWQDRARPSTLSAWAQRWPKISVQETAAHPAAVGVRLDELDIAESVQEDHVRARVGQVRYLGHLLDAADIPFVKPVGGHAIFLDARRFYPHLAQDQFPAQTLAAELYLDSGIRSMERGIVSAGRDPETAEHHYPKLELTRLAIPRRVYTQAHMDLVAESVEAVYAQRVSAKGLVMTYEPRYLRFFQARFERL